jgi:hypothetical protein
MASMAALLSPAFRLRYLNDSRCLLVADFAGGDTCLCGSRDRNGRIVMETGAATEAGMNQVAVDALSKAKHRVFMNGAVEIESVTDS